jgi:hypothetical protein
MTKKQRRHVRYGDIGRMVTTNWGDDGEPEIQITGIIIDTEDLHYFKVFSPFHKRTFSVDKRRLPLIGDMVTVY